MEVESAKSPDLQRLKDLIEAESTDLLSENDSAIEEPSGEAKKVIFPS
jgi:hypothetical protein